jgi:hypothetical protein
MIETIDTLAEGTVTAERGPLTYTAKWRVKGNTLIVFFGADQEAVILGMFEKEPETLARMLLKELLEQRFGGSS